MKKLLIKTTLSILCLLFSISAKSQCSVSISPQNYTMCNGDSVNLIANATVTGIEILDQSQASGNQGYYSNLPTGWSYWQSFTADTTGNLNRIEVEFASGLGRVLQMKLRKGTGNNGSILTTTSRSLPCSSCYVSFYLNAPIEKDSIYTFELITQYASVGSNVGAYLGYGYTRGVSNFSGNGFAFKTYVTVPNNTIYYNWSTGSNNSIIQVKSAGNYFVTVTDSLGCITSDTVSISVNPTPIQPILTVNGNVLMSSSSTGNQWYLNGSAINGATSQYYSVTQNGIYTTVVTDSLGCSSASDPFNFYTVSVSSTNYKNTEANIYPNPTSGIFTLETSANEQIIITDVLGKEIFSKKCNSQKEIIDLSNETNGIYFYKIESKNKIVKQGKIIVQ